MHPEGGAKGVGLGDAPTAPDAVIDLLQPDEVGVEASQHIARAGEVHLVVHPAAMADVVGDDPEGREGGACGGACGGGGPGRRGRVP